MLQYPIKTSWAITIIFIVASLVGSLLWIKTEYTVFEPPVLVKIEKRPKKPRIFAKIERPKPKPVSMERVKKQGCVTDGLLSEYNPKNNQFVSLVNRSECYYLHRAIETWRKPPDFETVNYVMSQITKKDLVYGMFIAEAVEVGTDYNNEYEDYTFDFGAMCRQGNENYWDDHACVPTFESEEYRNYVRYITQKAIDLGIQSFMFGQIYMQEGGEKKYAPEIVKDIRAYAKKKKVDIIVGAQTGSISDPEYLKIFDYIEGGIGLGSDGSIENGPCLSWRGSCWALLWHENFSSKAKNVLLHLDWTGIRSDDLDVFARMSQEKRAETLRSLYNYFTSKNMGFLMPFFGVLDQENGGCHGPKKKFYSPDNAYSCKDENVINEILSGK
jgi:hypothetical protein